MVSKTAFLGLIAATATPASSYINFGCGNALVEERADPIISPGQVSGHVHKIAGGNGFDFSMDYNRARSSTCSSCPIKQDLSNYWTPKLYFQAANGSFISVPTIGDDARELNGGMTVYYLQRSGDAAGLANLKAFPAGFRMVAGDPFKRAPTTDFAGQGISYACLGAGQPETPGFPNYNCPGGLRVQVFFPSCWDGVNLDSPDHKSHMSYPASGNYNNGPCPASHPVQFISLFYEVLYNTNAFANMWPNANQQPFVFASGDATGYGGHGDFINGWDVDVLQAVVSNCTNAGSIDKTACPPIDTFTGAEMNACRLPPLNEQVKGVLPVLPGCNAVTYGPAAAVPGANCPVGSNATASTTTTSQKIYYTDETQTKGWKYLGCATDSTSTRAMTGAISYGPPTMTIEYCIDWCTKKGFTLAGLEYTDQCFCDNTIPAWAAPQPGVLGNCNMPCGGNSTEYCGGPNALSLYQKCTSASGCTNVPFSLVSNADVIAGSSASASAAASSVSSSKPSSTISTKTSTSSVKAAAASSTTKTSSTIKTSTTTSSSKSSGTAVTAKVKRHRRALNA